ncbi:MAG: ABC transporter substrate-binding protein [Alphaproteobacteria bacterium]|nr:ABC transporter substrate-binding protein [Alphaproteobacteria bacterium]
MTFKSWIALAVVAAAVFGAGIAAAQQRDLTVVSWGGAYQDAQREVYFRPFTAATNIRLREDNWDGGIGVLRSRVQGGNNPWDVVQVESEELLLGCEEGLFERINWDAIGGRPAYLPDAVHDCGVGAILYNFVLAYDGARITGEGPRSWADFWNVQRWPGKRALRRGPKTNLEIALMADGVAPADVYRLLATPEGVERAFRKLDELRPHIVWWERGAQPPQLLASGEVAMASAYNGRISAANRTENRQFRMAWTNSLYTIDSWVIMRGSPNRAQAEQFLRFVGEPQRQAQLPPHIPYGVTNRGATALVPAAVMPELPTNPDNIRTALFINDRYWLENIDRLNQRFNAWVAR